MRHILPSSLALLLAAITAACAGRPDTTASPTTSTTGAAMTQSNPPATTLQIGDISFGDKRVWITGIVLAGTISEGDRLDAVGTATTPCTIDEVRVANARRPAATSGQECQLFLRNPDPAFARDRTANFFALVSSGAAPTPSTQLRASLTWISARDGGGGGPAIGPITADTRVELRFVDIKISATLKAPAVSRPPGGTNTWDLTLDKPLPLIPGFGFSMNINGQSAAMGKVLPALPASAPSSSR
jgi:translation elongation factor EF-Tu-like GTPase